MLLLRNAHRALHLTRCFSRNREAQDLHRWPLVLKAESAPLAALDGALALPVLKAESAPLAALDGALALPETPW